MPDFNFNSYISNNYGISNNFSQNGPQHTHQKHYEQCQDNGDILDPPSSNDPVGSSGPEMSSTNNFLEEVMQLLQLLLSMVGPGGPVR